MPIGTYPCINNLEFSQNIVWVFIHGMEDNLEVAKCLCSTVRPVLVAFDPAPLSLLCQHHNCSTVLFPNHSPEIFSCIGKWSLGGYESLLLVISLCATSKETKSFGILAQRSPKCLLNLHIVSVFP